MHLVASCARPMIGARTGHRADDVPAKKNFLRVKGQSAVSVLLGCDRSGGPFWQRHVSPWFRTFDCRPLLVCAGCLTAAAFVQLRGHTRVHSPSPIFMPTSRQLVCTRGSCSAIDSSHPHAWLTVPNIIAAGLRRRSTDRPMR